MIGPIFNQMSRDLKFLRLRGQETGIKHCIPPGNAENAKSREYCHIKHRLQWFRLLIVFALECIGVVWRVESWEGSSN